MFVILFTDNHGHQIPSSVFPWEALLQKGEHREKEGYCCTEQSTVLFTYPQMLLQQQSKLNTWLRIQPVSGGGV